MSHLVAQEKKRQHSIWLARNALFSCESIDAINTTSNTQALTKLTPADRTAKLLAFKKCFTGNFTSAPVPSKTIPMASSRFATQ